MCDAVVWRVGKAVHIRRSKLYMLCLVTTLSGNASGHFSVCWVVASGYLNQWCQWESNASG